MMEIESIPDRSPPPVTLNYCSVFQADMGEEEAFSASLSGSFHPGKSLLWYFRILRSPPMLSVKPWAGLLHPFAYATSRGP